MKFTNKLSALAGLFCAAVLAPCGTALAAASAPHCVEGRDYSVVHYFNPRSQQERNALFSQGGYQGTLCNDPASWTYANLLFPTSVTCTSIDLQGYLYLPSKNGLSILDRDLPLMVWADGTFSVEGVPPAQPLPDSDRYPLLCGMGTWFRDHGYAFLMVVRRGYPPSTGINEFVQFQGALSTGDADHDRQVLKFLANQSFELQQGINYMVGLKNLFGKKLVDPDKIAVGGHSYGGILNVLYNGIRVSTLDGEAIQAITDAQLKAVPKAQVVMASASESWDVFVSETGDENTSPTISLLKTSAANRLVPAMYLEPLNDASTRPTTVLGRAAGEAGWDYQAALFPTVNLNEFPTGDPSDPSAHGPFEAYSQLIDSWGPAVSEFLGRYGVKP